MLRVTCEEAYQVGLAYQEVCGDRPNQLLACLLDREYPHAENLCKHFHNKHINNLVTQLSLMAYTEQFREEQERARAAATPPETTSVS